MSDRRLLNLLLASIGVGESQLGTVYAALDKIVRVPHEVTREKLELAGLVPNQVERVMALADVSSMDDLERDFGHVASVKPALEQFGRYLGHLHALGVEAWVDIDLSIVRGLAYYTGTVFELFDARGELRAICGGGRYDNLLAALGGWTFRRLASVWATWCSASCSRRTGCSTTWWATARSSGW